MTAVVTLVTALACVVAGCDRQPAKSGAEVADPGTGNAGTDKRTVAENQVVSELIKTDQVVGTGAPITTGQKAVVHYTGWLYDPAAADKKGRKFDSSRDRGDPFSFSIGAGRVIKGWDLGVAGMQVGGQRQLIIPADLGYGSRGAGGVIPPDATLLFDVELVAIQ